MVNSGIHQLKEPPDPDREPYESQYRWVMLALVWLAYFAFGVIALSMSPLVTPILKDLNLSYSQMGIIMGAWPLTYIVVATIGGAVTDRWGIRKSIFVGIVLIGLSAILRYFVGGFATLFLCVALFGLGGPLISIGSPKTISLWFRGKDRGTAVGIYLTGAWIGGAISISTMNSVIMPLTGYSWRIAFVCLGLLALVIALLWWFLTRDAKPAEATESANFAKVFRGIINIRNVQLVLIMGFLSFAIGHGYDDWLPKILEVSGLSPATAGLAASIPIWVSIPTMIVVPRVVAAHLRGRIIALLSLVVAVTLLIIVTTSGIPLIIGLVVYGTSYCCVLPLLVLILMDLPEIGSKYMGSASGMFFCVGEIGGFAGPFLVGAIKDLTGGFLAGACFLAGLTIIRLFLALSIKTKPAYDIKTPS